MTTEIPFPHVQAAHCESGVISSLLRHRGIPIDEPMAFGIGAGLFFGHFPFVKIDRCPLTTFRMPPGFIIGQLCRALRVKIKSERFQDQATAMAALDKALGEGIPVGLQVGVFWLPFMPPPMRFHFNAHNLVVYGRNGNDYLISDPCFEHPVLCEAAALAKARFAKGPLAPRGRMYYLPPGAAPSTPVGPAMIRGARRTSFLMIRQPIPFVGCPGIGFLARRMEQWPRRVGSMTAARYMAQVIRMLEEIGTGGSGFRFLFAAYLRTMAGCVEPAKELKILSDELTDIGDRWMEFAVVGARICKDRLQDEAAYAQAAEILRDCAVREKTAFRRLAKLPLKAIRS
ncbi:MAG TPA: peptidase [Verrucomicrobia bacterium]|nr:MAG: hypothetical protein A2X46_17805 [Lentisphaerae bacterium GWF2_57_35]HBA86351.1 peptidase [Verrucomicrobiota bacterium]